MNENGRFIERVLTLISAPEGQKEEVLGVVLEDWREEYLAMAAEGLDGLPEMLYHKSILLRLGGECGLAQVYWNHARYARSRRFGGNRSFVDVIRPR